MIRREHAICMWGLLCATACVGDSAAPQDAGQNEKDAASDTAITSDASDAAADVTIDAGPRCNRAKPFTNVRLLDAINSAGVANEGARLSADEKTVYFTRYSSVAGTTGDVYVSTRPSTKDPFSVGLPLGGGNTADNDRWPTVTGDGLFVYIWNGPKTNTLVASRTTTNDPFGTFAVVNSITVSSATNNEEPFVLADHSAIYFAANATTGAGAFDLFRSTRVGGIFQTPIAVPGSNTASDELFPLLTPDELTLYFASNRSGTSGKYDIYYTTRTTTSSSFGPVQSVAELNSTGADFPSWVSADDCAIVFTSDRTNGSYQVWLAERPN